MAEDMLNRPSASSNRAEKSCDLENTVVISPLTNFIEASQGSWNPKSANVPALGIGLIGSVDSVPPNYVFKSVVVAGENVPAQWKNGAL